MMTEAEAKTKWCPFVRVFDWHDWFMQREGDDGPITYPSLPPAYNRLQIDPKAEVDIGAHDGQALRCIGSECMAWRWHMRHNPAWQDAPTTSDVPLYIADTEHGYCGLAGSS